MSEVNFEIRYGLGGGFGGCENTEWEPCFAQTLREAEEEAYERAIGVYESYEGNHGLRTVSDIMEEEECDEGEAEEIYREERESWLDWEVREVRHER